MATARHQWHASCLPPQSYVVTRSKTTSASTSRDFPQTTARFASMALTSGLLLCDNLVLRLDAIQNCRLFLSCPRLLARRIRPIPLCLFRVSTVRDDANRKTLGSASCYSSEQIGNNNRSKKKLRAAILRGTRYSPMEIPPPGRTARPRCRASLFDLTRRFFRSIAQRSDGRLVVRNQRKLQSQVQSANFL